MNFSKTIASIPDDFVVKIFPDAEISATGSMLRENSGQCAAWLQKHGFKAIGIHMGNSPEFLYLFAGALRAGVKVTLYNALKPADDSVFTKEKTAEILSEGNAIRFSEYEWGIDEALVRLQSSGTSGNRKFIEKSSRDFFGRRGFRPLWKAALRIVNVRVYNCSPWYHNTGLGILFATLSGGQCSEITTEKFNPNAMRQYINRTRPNFLICTPSMLTRCIHTGAFSLPPVILCTGEHLPHETIRLLDNHFNGQFLINSYGTTETSVISTLLYAFDSIKITGRVLVALLTKFGVPGSVFNRHTFPADCVGTIPKNVKVRILKDGIEQPEGSVGEIAVTKNHADFNTGDFGYVKGRLLFIVGRSSNVINRSGEKIIPAEIESVIKEFDGVEDAFVFGSPSATHGEDICAVIKTVEGREAVKQSELAEKLPKFMIPQHLFFLRDFPINASGKTDLMKLKDYVKRELAESDAP